MQRSDTQLLRRSLLAASAALGALTNDRSPKIGTTAWLSRQLTVATNMPSISNAATLSSGDTSIVLVLHSPAAAQNSLRGDIRVRVRVLNTSGYGPALAVGPQSALAVEWTLHNDTGHPLEIASPDVLGLSVSARGAQIAVRTKWAPTMRGRVRHHRQFTTITAAGRRSDAARRCAAGGTQFHNDSRSVALRAGGLCDPAPRRYAARLGWRRA